MLRRIIALICCSVLCLQSCRFARLTELESLGTEPEQFADLPVPRSYQLLTAAGQSWSHHDEKFRAAHFEYVGDGGINRLQQFLAAQLGKQGWALIENASPYHGRVQQKWTSRSVANVVYFLVTSLEAKGARTHLVYDLSTIRKGRVFLAGSAPGTAVVEEQGPARK